MITGPTASGKSEIALSIAEELGWDIISCDSRQIYRAMDIGTAKPSPQEMQRVRHWLIDIIDPSEAYSVYRFASEATGIIRKLHAENRVGLICGGTGLYLRGLIEGMSPQEESDLKVRDNLTNRAQNEGTIVLYNELREKDPVSANKIHENDLQRIMRALAVYYQTGKPLSELHREKKYQNEIEFIVIKTNFDREKLYQRINERVDMMIKQGLYDEFRNLIGKGFNENTPGMLCVGYREFFGVESNTCSFCDAVELIKRNTRRFAKRQITWFSHQQNGMEFDFTNGGERWKNSIKKFFIDNTTC